MGELEQQVKELAVERFGSVAGLARATNVSYTTLASLFGNGSFSKSRHENVQAVASALKLDPAWLMHGKLVDEPPSTQDFAYLPMFESLQAGQQADALAADGRFPVLGELAARYPDAFLLRVPDTAVNRILPQGCLALVAPSTTVEHPGQPYAVTVGDSHAVVRRARALANGISLEPDSTDPTWRACVYDFAEPDCTSVTIVGQIAWYAIPSDWRF